MEQVFSVESGSKTGSAPILIGLLLAVDGVSESLCVNLYHITTLNKGHTKKMTKTNTRGVL